MRCSLLSISMLLILALSLGGCAAPTAVSQTAVLPTTAPTVVFATTVPTAVLATTVPTAVPPTAARTATIAAPTSTPVQTTAAPTQAKPTTASSGTTKLDFNVLIPPGDGRDLVIENCMGCHSIAPVLVSQKTAGEWHGTSDNHRTNMGGVSDADYKKMFDYLAKNFGPDHKVPDLPPELLSGWTNY